MRIRSIVITAALITACKPAGETPEQATARMAAQADSVRTMATAGAGRWSAAMLANNMDSIVAMYASNAIVMPPGMPAARGRDDIKTLFTNLNAPAPATAFTVRPGNVAANGDVATESGVWVYTGKVPNNGPVVSDSGTYLIHWHRNGGNWEIMEHIWNSSNPPPPAAPARRS